MAAEKINISNYELEKLAKHLLPQIREDFEKWQQKQNNLNDISE